MNLVYKLRQSEKSKKILYFGMLFLLFCYVFSIPSFGERTTSLRYISYFALTLFGLVTILYTFLYKDFKFKISILFIPLFAIWSLVGTIAYSHQYSRWFSVFLLAISFVLFLIAFKSIGNKNLVLLTISLSIFLFSLYFIFYYRYDLLSFKNFASGSFRLGEYFDNPNGVAAYSMLGIGCSLHLLLFYRKKITLLNLIPIASSLLVGIATGSRSFIIAVLLFMIVDLYFVFIKHRWLYLIIVGCLIGLFILLINLPFMETIKLRLIASIETIFGFSSKPDTSSIQRILWADYGFVLGSSNGLIGYGAEGFSIFSGVGTYTHNNYSEVLCNFGFIGFVLFYIPLLIVLLKAIFDKKVDKTLIISFVVYYAVISITNVLYYKKFYFLLLALLYYIAYYEHSDEKYVNNDISSVIFTCDSLQAGGAEKVISVLSNEFSKLNIKTTIIEVSALNSKPSFYHLEPTIDVIKLCDGHSKKIKPLKRTILLRNTIKQIKPDFVISFLPHINVYTHFALIGLNIKHVVSERNNPINDPKNNFTKLLKRISFSYADGVVFQSTGAKNCFTDPIKEKSTIIPNPVIQNDCVDVSSAPRNNVILNVGRLTDQKNQFLLLKAFKEINDSGKYILKIYGDGPLKEFLQNESKKLGISDYVNFCGNCNNWQSLEQHDLMFVLPSNFEGMPNALIEALSLGLPCIATNCECGGPEELKRIGFDFDLCNVNDLNDLIACMRKNINHKNKVFTKNIEFSKKLSPEIIAKDWVEFLKTI